MLKTFSILMCLSSTVLFFLVQILWSVVGWLFLTFKVIKMCLVFNFSNNVCVFIQFKSKIPKQEDIFHLMKDRFMVVLSFCIENLCTVFSCFHLDAVCFSLVVTTSLIIRSIHHVFFLFFCKKAWRRWAKDWRNFSVAWVSVFLDDGKCCLVNRELKISGFHQFSKYLSFLNRNHGKTF